jgi:hypothetical protein
MRLQHRERENFARRGVEDARTAHVGGDDRLIVKQVDALGDLGAGEFLGQVQCGTQAPTEYRSQGATTLSPRAACTSSCSRSSASVGTTLRYSTPLRGKTAGE